MADQPFMSDHRSFGEQPFMSEQRRPSQQPLWDRPPAWEHDLDALVRPSFLVAPPPDVQQAILAAVLQAAVEAPRPAPVPVPASALAPAGRPVSFGAYLLLAAVLVAYAATLSWMQSLLGGDGWLTTLTAQLLAASEAIFGPLPIAEPLALTWLILERAPWLALLPLAWLLWERDQASDPSSDPTTMPQAA